MPLLVTLLSAIGIATIALGIVPAQFPVIGIRAIGAAAGWWPGEATDNDGEAGLATAIGLIALCVLTAVAVGGAAWIGARLGYRASRVATIVLCALLPAWVILCVLTSNLFFTSMWG